MPEYDPNIHTMVMVDAKKTDMPFNPCGPHQILVVNNDKIVILIGPWVEIEGMVQFAEPDVQNGAMIVSIPYDKVKGYMTDQEVNEYYAMEYADSRMGA